MNTHFFKTKLTTILRPGIAIICFLMTFSMMHAQAPDPQQKAILKSVENMDDKWGPCPDFMGEGCNIAVLQGNPKNPNADVFFRLEGNTSVPKHWHHSPERMVLISGKMRVNYDGQPPATIHTGNYAYGPAELPHTASCISDSPCVLFIAFENPIDAMPIEELEGSGK